MDVKKGLEPKWLWKSSVPRSPSFHSPEWPKFGRNRSKSNRSLAKLGRSSRSRARFCRIRAIVWRSQARAARLWPMSGQLSESGQTWSIRGRFRPSSGKSSWSLVEFGHVGSSLSRLGRLRPDSGLDQVWSMSFHHCFELWNLHHLPGNAGSTPPADNAGHGLHAQVGALAERLDRLTLHERGCGEVWVVVAIHPHQLALVAGQKVHEGGVHTELVARAPGREEGASLAARAAPNQVVPQRADAVVHAEELAQPKASSATWAEQRSGVIAPRMAQGGVLEGMKSEAWSKPASLSPCFGQFRSSVGKLRAKAGRSRTGFCPTRPGSPPRLGKMFDKCSRGKFFFEWWARGMKGKHYVQHVPETLRKCSGGGRR